MSPSSGRGEPHGPSRPPRYASADVPDHADSLATLTSEGWQLERRVTSAAQTDDAEVFLEGMFRNRHGLITLRSTCALSREVVGRMRARTDTTIAVATDPVLLADVVAVMTMTSTALLVGSERKSWW